MNRLTGFLAATSLLLVSAAHAQTLSPEKVKLDIASQPLSSALNRLAHQAGLQLMFYSREGDAFTAPALKGQFTAAEALGLLLENTTLEYEVLDSQTVAIRSAESEGKPIAAGSNAAEVIRLAQAAQSAAADSKGSAIAGSEEQSPAQGKLSSGERLEEIVVTAQKRMERLQDVPVAVSTVSGERLVNNHQLRLEDYFHRLPGVSLTLSGNGSEPMIVIRGMTTAPAGNPTAGVVIDEVPYGRSSSLSFPVNMPDIDPGDLQRVEVLRGPQGTLYGASSIGGLLKFVTLDPSVDGFSGRLQVGSTYVHQGNDLGHSVRGAVNVPLSDTLAVRLSGLTLEDPGYVDNAETGERDVNTRKSDGGRFSALWRPNNYFSLKLNALMQDSVRSGMSDSDTLLEPNLQRRELGGAGGYERKSRAYSATMAGTVGPVELVSATGYSIDELNNSIESFGLRAAANLFFPGSGRASLVTRMENEKFTQELRATLPIGERLSWLFGLFYTEEQDQYAVNAFANSATGAIAGLLVRNLGLPDTSFEERAAFSTLTVDVTDRFDIQFGGRYSENDQLFSRASVLLGANPIGAAPTFFQTSRSKDDAFTYLVTPRFKVSPDLMTYARVASGYRPGGPNFNCGVLPAELCEFDADTSTNYEIGVKGTLLDRQLSFDTSIFYIDWKDLQVGPLLFAGTSYLTNASRAISQGIELSAEARPRAGLNLSAWVVYNEAELAEPMAAPFSNGTTFIGKGTALPFSSRWTGNVSIDQEFRLASWNGARASIGVDCSYVGERPGTLSNTNLLRAKPSYVQINFRTGLEYEGWDFNAFVNNVTDERGILRGGDDGLSATLVNYIQPRTIGLSVAKSFGR